MLIIDGKKVSLDLINELKASVESFKAVTGKVPGLTVIIVGQDQASQAYVRNKAKTCKEIGMISTLIEMPAETDRKSVV